MTDKAARRSLFSVFTIAFLDNFGYSFVFILFAPLVLNPEYGFFSNTMEEGTKNILLGILIGIFPVFTFFGAPFWGDYADRFGRKKALILTILGTVAGHILSAVAIYTKEFYFLLIARGIAGFFSGNISICLATVSDLSPTAPLKGRNFGFLGVVMGAGWIFAMVLGGFLSDPKYSSPIVPFLVAAVLTFIGYLIIKAWFIETHRKNEGIRFDLIKSLHEIKASLQHREIRPFLLLMFIWTLGWYSTFQWFTAVSLERFFVTQEMASVYLIILGSFWVLGGVALNPFLVKRFSTKTLCLATMFISATFIMLSSWTSHFVVFSVIYCFSALAAPISFSNNLNLVSLSAPEGIQGKAMGFSQSFQSLAGVIVPLAGGLLAKWDIRLIFPIASLLLFIAVFLLLGSKVPKKASTD